MRSTSNAVRVRLYHLDADSGATTTLLYGTLTEALGAAALEAEDVQADLFIQTDNDVVGYLDLIGG